MLDIDFLVRCIEARQESITIQLSELTGKPDDRIKVIRLLEMLGELSGEMAFLRHEMLAAKKPVRKFALVKK
jgi:hypothetical protein